REAGGAFLGSDPRGRVASDCDSGCGPRRMAADVAAGAERTALRGGGGDCPGTRGTTRRDDGRGGEADPRERPRGVGGDRLLPVLRPDGGGVFWPRRTPRDWQRGGSRSVPLELPAGHPVRRYCCVASRREHGGL